MSETLTIKNFGPINDIRLELKKFNVVIGENATGKSTIAKVIAVCRYFSYIAGNNPTTLSESSSPFFQGLSAWDLKEFLKKDTYINYECNDYSFKVERKKAFYTVKDKDDSINFTTDNESWVITPKGKSTRFNNLLNELKKIQTINIDQINDPGLNWTIPTSFYQNDVAAVLDNPFYLPTERGLQSIFSLGKNSIQYIADSLFNQLANLDLVARNFKNETLIEPLDISYKNIDGRGYIKKSSEEEFYSLNNGASGYQSTIPIVLVVKYYNESRKKKKTFLIEEAELNLFPKAQKELVDYLVANTVNLGSQVLLTTHSPYILTALNNLMYAYEVGKTYHDKVEREIKAKYWLNSEDISVYSLTSEGTCEDILDREEKLIKAEKIDEVSGFLNEQFDALLNIELVKE